MSKVTFDKETLAVSYTLVKLKQGYILQNNFTGEQFALTDQGNIAELISEKNEAERLLLEKLLNEAAVGDTITMQTQLFDKDYFSFRPLTGMQFGIPIWGDEPRETYEVRQTPFERNRSEGKREVNLHSSVGKRLPGIVYAQGRKAPPEDKNDTKTTETRDNKFSIT